MQLHGFERQRTGLALLAYKPKRKSYKVLDLSGASDVEGWVDGVVSGGTPLPFKIDKPARGSQGGEL